MRADHDLIQRIGKSEMFLEYETAFQDATGLPLAIRPMEFWNLAHRNLGGPGLRDPRGGAHGQRKSGRVRRSGLAPAVTRGRGFMPF